MYVMDSSGVKDSASIEHRNALQENRVCESARSIEFDTMRLPLKTVSVRK